MAAQIHHSCNRNIFQAISEEITHITYAVKPIKKGELVCTMQNIGLICQELQAVMLLLRLFLWGNTIFNAENKAGFLEKMFSPF